MKPVRSLLLAASAVVAAISGALAADIAYVEGRKENNAYHYEVFNNALPNSSNFISGWNLILNAPFTVESVPDGWEYQTNNRTYVHWFSTAQEFPYPHDVPPQGSLKGFIIKSEGSASDEGIYGINMWNHAEDADMPSETPRPILAPFDSSEPQDE